MKVEAAITDVRSFKRMLEFQKESIRRLEDQAQRCAELVILTLQWPVAIVDCRVVLGKY